MMASCLSMATTIPYKAKTFNTPSASLSILTGSRTRASVSLNVKSKATNSCGSLLHSAFTSPILSLSSSSSFSGGSSLNFNSNYGLATSVNKRRGFVVRASKYTLCQTKRNRSRKSLARTHGFRQRMSTTSGRAVIRRRRAKGRWALCTKTNPISGKRRP